MNTRNYQQINNATIEIDLVALLKKLCVQWRAILIFSIIIGLLASGARYVKDMSAYNASLSTQNVSGKEAVETSGLKQEEIDAVQQAVSQKRQIKVLTTYMTESEYMNLDAMNCRQLSILYYIKADRGLDAADLLAVYNEMLQSDDSVKAIKEAAGVKVPAKYIRELISAYDAKSSDRGGYTQDSSTDVMKVTFNLPEGADSAIRGSGTVYKGMKDENKELIFNLTDDKVCPYCNRTYIEYVKKDSLHTTYELDHYYNKDDFPFLAVSLYNLIPVCPSCNRIKGKKKFLYYPYDEKNSYGDSRFGYEIKGTDFWTDKDDLDITIDYFNEGLEKDQKNTYIEELYQTHKDVAQEIIRKCQYFGKWYAKSLTTAFPADLFQDESEIYRMVFENYLDEEDFGKRPLSKMTRDIADETLSILGIEHEWG